MSISLKSCKLLSERVIELDFSENVNSQVHQIIRSKLNSVKIIDVVWAYKTVCIYFNPLLCDYKIIFQKLKNIDFNKKFGSEQEEKVVEVPVCFCSLCALDKNFTEEFLKIRWEDFVEKYIKEIYTVLFIGFQPGFPFLDGLPVGLTMPRLKTPRLKVPAGSVGIGGKQTGIYTTPTPGGWRVIGKTRMTLFNVTEGALLKPGDKVKFFSEKHNEVN